MRLRNLNEVVRRWGKQRPFLEAGPPNANSRRWDSAGIGDAHNPRKFLTR
jgi:hypothetical protein